MSGSHVFRVKALLSQAKFLEGSIWLTLQQISVAASVAFLALAAERLDQPAEAVWFLVAFILCMIVAYGFGIMSILRYDQWYLQSLSAFLKFTIANHVFTPRHYPRDQEGEQNETVFTNTAPSVLSEFCSYVMTLLSSSLNATLTVAAVAIVVDWRIAAAYGASFLGCLIFGRLVSGITSTAAFKSEEARVHLASHGATMWPNLAIGNRHAVANWEMELWERFSYYATLFNRNLRIQSWSQFIIALISLFPTPAVLLLVALSARNDPTQLAAVLVVAPRIFQILLSLNELSVAIYDWNQVKGRIAILDDFFTPPEDRLPLVSAAELTFADTRGGDIADILQRLERGTPGRILLSGPNGSGKTTFLLTLKQGLGEKAFYLPCQSRLCLPADEDGSTGQQKRSEIEYLHALDDLPPFVFLDEWDASLDPKNREAVNAMIDGLSQRSLVIEVRHRMGGVQSKQQAEAVQVL